MGEVAQINPSSPIPENFYYVDLESVKGSELLSYRNENIRMAPSRAQRLAKNGDIFYQTVRPYQKNNYMFDKDENNFVFSTGFAQIRSQIHNLFLFYYLNTDKFVNLVLNNCTGTSYPAINSSELKKIPIIYPKNTTEQEAVGNIVDQLEKTITLLQRE